MRWLGLRVAISGVVDWVVFDRAEFDLLVLDLVILDLATRITSDTSSLSSPYLAVSMLDKRWWSPRCGGASGSRTGRNMIDKWQDL